MSERLSVAKRDEMLIRVDEQTKSLPMIEKHLEKLNDSVAETNIKLAKTDAIAKASYDHSQGNRRYLDRLTISVIIACVAALSAVVIAGIQMANIS